MSAFYVHATAETALLPSRDSSPEAIVSRLRRQQACFYGPIRLCITLSPSLRNPLGAFWEFCQGARGLESGKDNPPWGHQSANARANQRGRLRKAGPLDGRVPRRCPSFPARRI